MEEKFCTQCGKTMYVERICYNCEKENLKQEILSMTEKEVSLVLDKIINNMKKLKLV